MISRAKPKVFGTGLIALDLVLGAEAKTPVRSWAGGTCGNVLAILAYFGWDAFPIARLNGDPASERVRADLAHWGVQLDFASCEPTVHTPIIVQQIRRGRDGKPRHRFSWSCPKCGEWLPPFKAVTKASVLDVAPAIENASVFFFDRLSRAALSLATEAAQAGAVVVFEPSAKGDSKLMAEALSIAHIVKYADQRLAELVAPATGLNVLVEIQTLGEKGLRYRHRLTDVQSDWRALDAITAPRLADSCGSGDWLTAGVLSKIAGGGLAGLRKLGPNVLESALRYGQALAAWNCGFEGARGSMYAASREKLDEAIAALLSGRFDHPNDPTHNQDITSIVDCPACSRSNAAREHPNTTRAAVA
jgi:fructokinase